MKSLEQFLALLTLIPDPRRAEGELYQLPHVLLFSILAIVSGANSYRGVGTFIKVHRRKLNKAFKIGWKRPPAHTSIRFIPQGLKVEDVEKAFREHAANLNSGKTVSRVRALALDGKALKGSFDAFNDTRAKQMLGAFAAGTALVLAHIEIDEKSNEIPAVRKLLEELDVADHIVTCDAMHCQKNLRSRGGGAGASDRSVERQPANVASKSRSGLQRRHAPFRRSDGQRQKAQSSRNPRRRRVRAAPAVMGTQWEPCVAAIIQVERIVPTFQPATGLWRRSCELFCKVWI